MSTTSLKLPDDVKNMAMEAAAEQGISTHAFMVDAIRIAASSARTRAEFVAEAMAALNETLDSNAVYSADDIHAYAEARLRGEKAVKPKAKKWR